MKNDQTAKWLRITFFTALCIFFLTSVYVIDTNILYIIRFLPIPTADIFWNPELWQILHRAQYLNIAIFLISLIVVFRQNQNWLTVAIFTLLGFSTLLNVLLFSVFKELFNIITPLTSGGGTPILDKLTVYISTLSGFIAAITGLYSQIIAGRKTLAEVEVEKLRLQVEQEKAKSGKKKSTKYRK